MKKLDANAPATKGDIAPMKGDIQRLQHDVTGIKREITTIKGDITTMKGDITGLKEHLQHLEKSMNTETTELRNDVSSLRSDMKCLEKSLLETLAADKEEIKRHFEVVAENMWHELLGANKDELSLMRDTTSNHEHRISRLEKIAGVSGYR